MDCRLNVRAKTIKLLEGNMGINFHKLRLGIAMHPKHKRQQQKNS